LQPALESTTSFLLNTGIKAEGLQSGSVKTEKQENRDRRSGELIGQGVPLTINNDITAVIEVTFRVE